MELFENTNTQDAATVEEPTISLMKISDMPNEMAGFDDIVIEFVPGGQCRKLWTWDSGKRAEEKPIRHGVDEIYNHEGSGSPNPSRE